MVTSRFLQCSIFFILSVFAFSSGHLGRVRDRIYFMLSSNKQCFRILNGTHQVGCQSSQGGSYGVLKWIESEADCSYVKNDPAGHGPFIAAMDMKWFANKPAILSLHDSGKLAGILVFLSDESKSIPFSEDVECPNDESGLYKNDPDYGSCQKGAQSWNQGAIGYRFMDFKIPIFLVHNATEERILRRDCYDQFNSQENGSVPNYPLCAVELQLFNLAAGSAERCSRRNELISGLEANQIMCDPLNGTNIYAFLPATNKSSPLADNSVLMLATRMDSFSMFSDYEPGAASSLGNLITMLSIAEALGRNKEFLTNSSANTGKYLMPVFFNGESLDYIGSSRMVYDIKSGRFPPGAAIDDWEDKPALLSFNNLALILELNQVSTLGENRYFFHVDPKSMSDNPKTLAIVKNASASLVSASSGILEPTIDWNLRLPPASVQRFLMANRSVPALVITDHEKQFQNRYYNSFTDKPNNVDRAAVKDKMLKLANAVTKFAFEWVSDGDLPASDWKVNEAVMDRWMDCFWGWPNFTCAVFDRFRFMFRGWDNSYGQPDNNFQRSYMGPRGGPLPRYLQYSMSYLLGERYLMPNQTNQCSKSAFSNRTGQVNTYLTMVDLFDNSNNSTYCYVSTVDIAEAMSPAFMIDKYDFKSGQYSTWMESRWSQSSLRIFLRASTLWEGSVLGVGLLVSVLSLIIVYVLSVGSDVIFSTTEVTAL